MNMRTIPADSTLQTPYENSTSLGLIVELSLSFVWVTMSSEIVCFGSLLEFHEYM